MGALNTNPGIRADRSWNWVNIVSFWPNWRKHTIPAYRTLMQKDDKAQAQTGARTVRSGCQTGDAGNLPGFEDQAAKDKQEPLQDWIASRNYELS